MKTTGLGVIILVAAMVAATGTQADTFGMGANQFAIDFVNIGYAGNAADIAFPGASRGYGAVDHNYRIGTLEVTIEQFTKAYAADNRIGSGDEGYWNSGDGVSTPKVGTGAPVSYVSVWEAMKFANWLTTGDAYTGAYQFTRGLFGGDYGLTAIDRDAAVATYGTVYVLPTEDEWYKAGYFKSDASGYSLYANGSDDAADLTHGTTDGWNYYKDDYAIGSPNYVWETGFGGEEQNGTYDMMGNIAEWTETARDGTLKGYRVVRGGTTHGDEYVLRASYFHTSNPYNGGPSPGFRVAVIPEPSSMAMVGVVSGFGLFIRRKFMV